MADRLDLVVTGVGLTTPVGLGAAASCAALRAGISRLAQVHSALVSGEQVEDVPAVGGRVPTEWLDGPPEEPEWPGHDRFEVEAPVPEYLQIESGAARLEHIGRPALREAWEDAGLDRVTTADLRVGYALGLSTEDDARTVADRLNWPTKAACEIATRDGRAAFWSALREGAKRLLQGEIDVLVVGGLDSRVRGEILVAMASAGTLKTDTQPHGTIPGEAAGFVVIEREEAARTRGATVRARLPVLVAEHEETVGTDEANRAAALGRAFQRIHRAAEYTERDRLVICDLNGDRYRHIEWGYAATRGLPLEGDIHVWHPADCIGDAGAASGAVNLIWAVEALTREYAETDRILVWGASDGPLRAASLVCRGGD